MTSPAFPVSLDALANPGPTTETDDAGFELDLVVGRLQNIAMALEQKLGIGASTPPGTAAVLRRTATGASAWGPLVVADIDPLGLSGLAQDNPIINGDFSIWQRGLNLGAGYTADRWNIVNTTTAVPAATRQTNSPPVSSSSPLTPSVLFVGFTTADAAVAAGDQLYLDQMLEGYAWAGLAQRQFTVSFWVRATKTGKHCLACINGGADRSYVAEYTVNAAATWEYKTITVAASPLMSDGTWFTDNRTGLYLRFVMMAGSTYLTATPNTWIAGNFTATAGVANDADNTANVFQLAQVAVTPGPYAAPFAARPYAQELALCQRYYQKGTVQTAAPLTAAATYMLQSVSTAALNGGRTRLTIPFPVVMRTVPSVRYWDALGTLGKVSSVSTDTTTNNVTPVVVPPHTASDYGMQWLMTSEPGMVFGYDLNAEL